MSTKFSPPARLLKALRRGKSVVNRAERIPRLKRPTFEDCVEPEPLGNPGIGPNAETVVGRNQLVLGSLRPDQYQRSVADDDSEVALPRVVRPVVPDIARCGRSGHHDLPELSDSLALPFPASAARRTCEFDQQPASFDRRPRISLLP